MSGIHGPFYWHRTLAPLHAAGRQVGMALETGSRAGLPRALKRIKIPVGDQEFPRMCICRRSDPKRRVHDSEV